MWRPPSVSGGYVVVASRRRQPRGGTLSTLVFVIYTSSHWPTATSRAFTIPTILCMCIFRCICYNVASYLRGGSSQLAPTRSLFRTDITIVTSTCHATHIHVFVWLFICNAQYFLWFCSKIRAVKYRYYEYIVFITNCSRSTNCVAVTKYGYLY